LENVALPLLLAGGNESKARREAADMLERLDLVALGDKLPEEISGGQSQRAGIARSLVGQPRLILADEPTGQQDRATGQRLMRVVRSRAEETGAALLVATHDPAVAQRLDIRWSFADRRLETGVVLRSA
jgi:putative ABC transport system ATP-binding protein